MPQAPDHAVQVALITALFIFAGSLLTLAGVLYTTRSNAKLGNRAEDRTAEGQKVSAQQQLIDSIIESAKAAPELVTQVRDLIKENARFQADIISRDRKIDDLTQDVDDLKTAVQRLDSQCQTLTEQAKRVPELEAQLADLRQQLKDKQAELERTVLERDIALRAQEVAEAALSQAQRTISEKIIPCP